MKNQKLSVRFISLFAVIFLLWISPNHAQSEKFSEGIAESRETAKKVIKETNTPGLGVAVAIGGKIVWAEGFGFADLEQKVPVTRETKFAIGSITKSLTTAVFAKLVEDGKADWDTPIENYLSRFPCKDKKISVRLIAGHASGLGDNFGMENPQTSKYYASTDEVLKEVFKEPLQSEPGTKHFYATTSYGLIAGVIEKQIGKDFRTALNELVLNPLNLISIVPNNRKDIIPHRTEFYVLEDNKIVNAPFYDSSHKLAGAGYLSTAEDLAKFGVAMSKPGFLKQESLNQLYKQTETKEDGVTRFALGWRIAEDSEGRKVIHQPGGGIGISCWLWIYPKEDVVIAILGNRTVTPVGGEIFRTISKTFLNAK